MQQEQGSQVWKRRRRRAKPTVSRRKAVRTARRIAEQGVHGKKTNKPQRSMETAAALTFRPRTEADDEFIVQLTEEQLGEVHQQAFAEPFPREQFRRYIQSGAPTTVVEHRGKRIGYYSYLVDPDGKMHISALVIDRTQQSDGVGTAVMKKLESEAAAMGVHTLEVFVQANNTRSVEFTRKLGFTEVFRLPPNTICFQKRIGGAGIVGVPDGQVGAAMHGEA
ncbi:GNAT family N-acetyltransferase [Alicyclobacillus herbarius]|uniref:GNAT family N-acetyltransferase n=1 Tax=Alicyclobacillus herbarius TaxID=122960 RepID=UPI0003FFE1CD|nr:GNAT family N-acetyltransferase [Alicyclobacillus herbarius]